MLLLTGLIQLLFTLYHHLIALINVWNDLLISCRSSVIPNWPRLARTRTLRRASWLFGFLFVRTRWFSHRTLSQKQFILWLRLERFEDLIVNQLMLFFCLYGLNDLITIFLLVLFDCLIELYIVTLELNNLILG